MKKNILFISLFLLIISYLCYSYLAYKNNSSRITFRNTTPEIKLSELIDIKESRVRYSKTLFIDNFFSGFNAVIDNDFYITVTKLGLIENQNIKILNLDHNLDNINTDRIGFPPVETEDLNSRFLKYKAYPFKINQVYFFLENGSDKKIITNKFLEIESICSNIYLFINQDNSSDFGFVGMRNYKTISFIYYDGNLFVLQLHEIQNKNFKNLHELIT